MPRDNYVSDFWRSHNFRLEPWGNDYEPPIQISEELFLSESDVNPTVETENWDCFQSPQARSLPNRLIFIDGRRRLDAALVGGNGNTIFYGIFGTIAVGAVVLDRSVPQASCSQISIRRVLGFGGKQEAVLTRIPCSLGSKAELVYEPVKPSQDNTPEVRGLIVQNAMLAAEEQLVTKQMAKDPDTLVIRDGRLSYNSPDFLLGYVKTMHKNYLSEKYAALLWELAPGERSPIFLIGEKNRPRYSWYLKSGTSQISSELLAYQGLHGIVRLELSSEISLETAKEIANQTCYLIPHYASHPSQDPRAPQNLAPVSALERELGRRMGNAILIKRRLQSFLASFGDHE
jgi:uncharacterized protein